MKIIDILNNIANRDEVPLKVKWRNKIWEYYSRNQDYYDGNGNSLFENMAMVRTLDFITDEVEILKDGGDNDNK